MGLKRRGKRKTMMREARELISHSVSQVSLSLNFLCCLWEKKGRMKTCLPLNPSVLSDSFDLKSLSLQLLSLWILWEWKRTTDARTKRKHREQLFLLTWSTDHLEKFPVFESSRRRSNMKSREKLLCQHFVYLKKIKDKGEKRETFRLTFSWRQDTFIQSFFLWKRFAPVSSPFFQKWLPRTTLRRIVIQKSFCVYIFHSFTRLPTEGSEEEVKKDPEEVNL